MDWIAQIAANPDDDAPRLVYADSLIERGDPRGEFIAAQCALARHDATDEDVGDIGRLRSRERTLLKKHEAQWTAPTSDAVPGWRFEYRRGFIEIVEPFSKLDHYDRLLEVEPLVRGIRLSARFIPLVPFDLEEVFTDDSQLASALPVLRDRTRLRRLSLTRAVLVDFTMRELLELPQPIAEYDLGFDGRLARFPTNWCRGFAERVDLERLAIRQLRHLDVLCKHLVELQKLRSIALENADIKPGGLYALATIPNLESLDIAENYSQYTLAGIDAARLLEAPRLRRLRLSKLGMSDKQAKAIAASPHAARLTRLDLARNHISDEGALAIARSEHLQHLRKLNLNANKISETAKTELRNAFPKVELQLR